MKMTSPTSSVLPIAIRNVTDAVELDNNGRTKEAYCTYLGSILFIIKSLKDYAWDHDFARVCNEETVKLLKLAGQCHERANDIVLSFQKREFQRSASETTARPDPIAHDVGVASWPDASSNDQNQQRTQLPSVPSNPPRRPSPVPPHSNNVDKLIMALPTPPKSLNKRGGSVKSIDQIQNRQIFQAYQRRKSLQTNSLRNLADNNLERWRKSVEDMAIEKARRKVLKKKLQERRERLKEKAEQRFAHQTGSRITDAVYQKNMYTKILEFEQETSWPESYREKLVHEPENTQLIEMIVCNILRSKEHPIGQIMAEMQYALYKELSLFVADFACPVYESLPYERDAGIRSNKSEKRGQESISSENVHDISNDPNDFTDIDEGANIKSSEEISNQNKADQCQDITSDTEKALDSDRLDSKDNNQGSIADRDSSGDSTCLDGKQNDFHQYSKEKTGNENDSLITANDKTDKILANKLDEVSAESIRTSSSAFDNVYSDFEDFMLQNLDSGEFDYPLAADEHRGSDIGSELLDEMLETDSIDSGEVTQGDVDGKGKVGEERNAASIPIEGDTPKVERDSPVDKDIPSLPEELALEDMHAKTEGGGKLDATSAPCEIESADVEQGRTITPISENKESNGNGEIPANEPEQRDSNESMDRDTGSCSAKENIHSGSITGESENNGDMDLSNQSTADLFPTMMNANDNRGGHEDADSSTLQCHEVKNILDMNDSCSNNLEPDCGVVDIDKTDINGEADEEKVVEGQTVIADESSVDCLASSSLERKLSKNSTQDDENQAKKDVEMIKEDVLNPTRDDRICIDREDDRDAESNDHSSTNKCDLSNDDLSITDTTIDDSRIDGPEIELQITDLPTDDQVITNASISDAINDSSTTDSSKDQPSISNDSGSKSDSANPLSDKERVGILEEPQDEDQSILDNDAGETSHEKHLTDDSGESNHEQLERDKNSSQDVATSASCDTDKIPDAVSNLTDHKSEPSLSNDDKDVENGIQFTSVDIDGENEGWNNNQLPLYSFEDTNPDLKRTFQKVVKEVHSSLNKLHSLLIVSYDELDMPIGRDQSYASLETVFFEPLWPWLYLLFRKFNLAKEMQLYKVIRKRWKCEPSSFFIRQQFTLSDSEAKGCPYQPAVDELRKVTSYKTPLDKLECIVQTTKLICQCVKDYWEKKSDAAPPNVGCDDLLPILTYVVVKAALPQLVSECHSMEEFIHENYLLGEEGYCLTTLSTAIAYTLNLNKGAMPGDVAS